MKTLSEKDLAMFDPEVRPVLMTKTDIKKDIWTCSACGITDSRVECSGIYHCPNPLCSMCGAGFARSSFGFHESEDSQGVTPTKEWVILQGWARRMVKEAK